MWQTLFPIPDKIGNWPVFGFGLLLAVWAVVSIAILAWMVRRYGFGPQTLSYLPAIAIFGGVIVFILPFLVEGPHGLPIRGYGVMMLLGVLGGVMLAAYRAPAARLDPEMVFSLAFWLFVVGIAGARLFHVIQYWHSYHQSTLWGTLGAIVNVPKGGLVIYGSVIGVLLMLPIFCWKYKQPGLAVCDLVAPSFMVGLALGRIGCLLNGCCFGGLCDSPVAAHWAIQFPAQNTTGVESPPYQSQHEFGMLHGFQIGTDRNDKGRVIVKRLLTNAPREAGLKVGDHIIAIADRKGELIDLPDRDALANAEKQFRETGAGRFDANDYALSRAKELLGQAGRDISLKTAEGKTISWTIGNLPSRSLPVHPTQIYSTIDALLICLFLLAYYPFRRRDGEVAALMLTIYPVTRFLIELLRSDEPGQFGTNLTIAQWVGLAAIPAVIGLWWYVLRQPRGKLWAEAGPPVVSGGA